MEKIKVAVVGTGNICRSRPASQTAGLPGSGNGSYSFSPAAAGKDRRPGSAATERIGCRCAVFPGGGAKPRFDKGEEKGGDRYETAGTVQ